MIEVSVSGFFVVLVVAAFASIGLAAVLRRFREWRQESRVRHRTSRCRYCGILFRRGQGHGKVEQCPGCRASLQAGRDRRLG